MIITQPVTILFMIKSFRDRDTENIFKRQRIKRLYALGDERENTERYILGLRIIVCYPVAHYSV